MSCQDSKRARHRQRQAAYEARLRVHNYNAAVGRGSEPRTDFGIDDLLDGRYLGGAD
jgi:hypothetical protein